MLIPSAIGRPPVAGDGDVLVGGPPQCREHGHEDGTEADVAGGRDRLVRNGSRPRDRVGVSDEPGGVALMRSSNNPIRG